MDKTKQFKYSNNFVILICFVLIFSACKSSKYATVNTNGSVKNKNDKEVISDILKSQLDYKTISGKATIELTRQNGGSGMKTNCYIKLLKDTELQLSVRIPFINSEAFRLNITPDSVYIIDRLNKNYAIESIKDYQNKYNIDLNFYNLQAILTNSLFVPGNKVLSTKDSNMFSIAMVGGLFYVETKDKNNTKYSFAINAKDRIESVMIYNKEYNFNIEWIYTNFVQNTNAQIYPTNIGTKINVDGRKVSLNISYSSLDINSDIQIDRQMPSKYQKNTISGILRNYIK